jgi:hypothetical protein
MALANAAWTQQHNILGSLNKRQRRQLLNLCTWYAAGEGEVILFDRLDRRQGRQLHQCGALALKASIVLNV